MNKNNMTLYLIIIIGILIMIMIYLLSRLEKAEAESERMESIIQEKEASIKYHESVTGRVIAEKEAATATTKEVIHAYSSIVKEMEREFDIKIKDVKAFVKSNFQAQGQGQATVINNFYKDSTGNEIKYKSVVFDDGYLHFESTVFDSLKAAFSKYTYSDTILMAFHGKRKWIFGKETLYASARLSNPSAKILNTTNVIIHEAKDKRLFIGPMAGFDPFNTTMFIGIGIGYGLVKF